MHFKLIIALVEDAKTNTILNAAREAGATGTTVIKSASGEGAEESKTFFGLTLEAQRDVLLLLVEEHLSRHILETIKTAGEFETQKGAGIAFQIDVEDVVGITHQIEKLSETVEEKL
ncbi:P-II family nitrogen regulator [uncultured Cocleimonas sp.]|uniref:P-II family nitrogen regulator n=1 Tax=uncultured Cocleimonas sp. TaxID=1051587 RepID=UPI002628BE04|nr:P-II family nitrogen regulator [uncultured Cocleimonas sp.]